MAKKTTVKFPSRSFRLVCEKQHIPAVEDLLMAEGFAFEPEPFSMWCRILTAEPRPLGSSLAACLGLIYIQDRSSMLPPLALIDADLQENLPACAVLDMCSSPGSKTGFLAQLVGRHGFVLGNEPSSSRLSTLRANMQQLGFLQVATSNHAGESLPLEENSWRYIQLDPPCSGWGTVAKNPQVLDLWQGKKINPLIDLQRKLLKKAYDLLSPGGVVVYSTCTTNIDENEEQVKYATNELGFELVPLQFFKGFTWEDSPISGTLQVDGARSTAQGFYIAKLRKPTNTSTSSTAHNTYVTQNTYEDISPSMLEDSCTDLSLLPHGKIILFGNTVRFVPSIALPLLGGSLRWQAAGLGKMLGDAKAIRLLARMTMLMPHNAPSHAIVLEKIQDIQALLQGQSIKTNLSGRETGLYYSCNNGIVPLGRVTLKQGRALWSAR